MSYDDPKPVTATSELKTKAGGILRITLPDHPPDGPLFVEPKG